MCPRAWIQDVAFPNVLLKSPLEALATTVRLEYREQVRVCGVVERHRNLLTPELFIIRLCTNKIALKFTLLKQHIKMTVLF